MADEVFRSPAVKRCHKLGFAWVSGCCSTGLSVIGASGASAALVLFLRNNEKKDPLAIPALPLEVHCCSVYNAAQFITSIQRRLTLACREAHTSRKERVRPIHQRRLNALKEWCE